MPAAGGLRPYPSTAAAPHPYPHNYHVCALNSAFQVLDIHCTHTAAPQLHEQCRTAATAAHTGSRAGVKHSCWSCALPVPHTACCCARLTTACGQRDTARHTTLLPLLLWLLLHAVAPATAANCCQAQQHRQQTPLLLLLPPGVPSWPLGPPTPHLLLLLLLLLHVPSLH
jgi:hypothetical protein